MCGIAGIIDFSGAAIDRSKVEDATRALAHRGPDDEGYYFSGNVALGHRRLSIIDLGGGKQPMSIDGGALTAIYNGEIYNFLEVRRELEQHGHSFSTRSDTEVLLTAYKQWGENCLDRLNGMFAFAIWDKKRKRCFVARDRLGIKPFVYAQLDGRFYFASELRALLKMLPATPDIYSYALVSYLALQYVPGENTILKNIKRLEPGEAAIISTDGFKKWKWWDIQRNGAAAKADAAERLRELITDSVRLRLISDVPLGAFLSGGIDSSTIVGSMHKFAEGRIKTFQVAFDDSPEFDETVYAKSVAEKFGCEHEIYSMNPHDLAALLPKIAAGMGEPIADPALIPTYVISGCAQKKVTVALSGEGGDELFAGYLRYRLIRYAKYMRFAPSFAAKWGRAVAGTMPRADRWRKAIDALEAGYGAAAHLAWVRVFDQNEIAELLPESDTKNIFSEIENYFGSFFKNADEKNFLRNTLNCDLKTWLPCDLLAKVDMMSMAHGLEARVPMLDYRIVEFAAGLDEAELLDSREGKLILKKAVANLIPPEIAGRKKKGFDLPLDAWFRGPLKKFIEESADLAAEKLPMSKNALDKILREHISGRKNYGLKLFSIALLGHWMEGL